MLESKQIGKWEFRITAAAISAIGLILAGVGEKVFLRYAEIPGKVETLKTQQQTDEDKERADVADLKAAILDIQSNSRTILSMMRQQ